MSATDALGKQWPRYEQDTDGPEHDVPIEHYGVRQVLPGEEKDQRKNNRFHPLAYTAHVPLDQIQAGQGKVDANHVARLSTIPSHVLEADHDNLPQAIGVADHLGGGIMLKDGHHRLAAAVRRGDTHMRVRVSGHYGERYDGLR